VRRALDEGYDVRCLVRPRLTPADFLREWGATTVQGDLNDPSSLPAALVGISIVVDCATSKPEEPIRKVDWEAKCALIQCAAAMRVQRYIFFSIDKCDQHREVPLMDLKYCTEQYLAASGLQYTVLRLTGFMQPLISAYAVPILEEQSVWGTSDTTRTAYLDTQDVARMTLAALRKEATVGRVLTLSGPRAYTVAEVIALCEKMGKQEAKVTRVPVGVLKFTRAITVFFQWFGDAADRLAFAEVLASNESFQAPMDETYALLGMSEADTNTLEKYFDEFYTRILKKLKEVGGSSKQRSFCACPPRCTHNRCYRGPRAYPRALLPQTCELLAAHQRRALPRVVSWQRCAGARPHCDELARRRRALAVVDLLILSSHHRPRPPSGHPAVIARMPRWHTHFFASS